MIPLPTGWRWSTVADVGRVDLGRQRHPDWHTGPNMRRYLRVANVFEDRIDTSDVMEMDFTGVFERYRLQPGDVLLNEGQTPELLGRPAIYRGQPEDVAFTNSLLRFRAGPDVSPEWALAVFRHHMHSGRFARESRITTNIAHLSVGRFKAVEFPVPPLSEQRRIVEILEDHLSRLDAAEDYASAASRRLPKLHESNLRAALSSCEVEYRPLGAVLAMPLTNGRSVPTRDGGFPVLRLTALTPRGVDLQERKGGAWTASEAGRFLVSEGDFLVARGNGSIRRVGRGSLVRHSPDPVAFPDTVIRVRPNLGILRADYLDHVWNAHGTRSQIESMARTTAGIYKVNQKQLALVQIPVPALDVQSAIAADGESSRGAIDAMARSIESVERRSRTLRRAVLAAAFSGKLAGRHTDQEVIEELADVRPSWSETMVSA